MKNFTQTNLGISEADGVKLLNILFANYGKLMLGAMRIAMEIALRDVEFESNQI